MIALFGGSFDPVHLGHLRIAEDIREYFSFEKIIFIPAFISPLKERSFAPAEKRLEMLKIAISDNPYFEISDYEIKKEGKSYTIETAIYYRNILNYNPIFILGLDSILTLHKWKEPEKLLKIANFIVVQRGEERFDILKDYLSKNFPFATILKDKNIQKEKTAIYLFNSRKIDISSTEIRERIKSGKSIKYLVLPQIEDYIYKNKLYL